MNAFYTNESNRELPPLEAPNVSVISHHQREVPASSRTSRTIGQCVNDGSTSNTQQPPRSNLVSDAQRQESAYPWSLQHRSSQHRSSQHRSSQHRSSQHRSLNLRGNCACRCTCGSSPTAKVKDPPKAVQNETSYLSSWRLLHMCRSKLKGSASTSELLAGFATVAMVEVNIRDPTLVPEWLFVVFTATTSLLVAVHIFALMISTYVLPNIDAIFKTHAKGALAGAPHESMRLLVDVAWTFSTLLGLFLFLFDVAVICWIQLLDFSFTASLVGSLIVGPVMIAFMAIVVHFHKKLIIG